MRLRIGQVAVLVAGLLAVAGCAAPGPSDSPGTDSLAPDSAATQAEAPILVQPRIHHDAMRERAEDYCAPFGGEPELVDWRYRSTFGKRGEWRLQTLWVCREAAE